MTFINPTKLLQEVIDKNIQCCARCEHYNTYEHDYGWEWECEELIFVLDDEPYENVFKQRECCKFEESIELKYKRDNK